MRGTKSGSSGVSYLNLHLPRQCQYNSLIKNQQKYFVSECKINFPW